MSYILDALRKAERERHAAKIPTLHTVHRIPWQRRHLQWMWIAAAAVLVNAALVIWFLRPEPAPRTSSGTATPTSTAALASTPASAPGPRASAPATDRTPPAKPAVVATAPAEPSAPRPLTSRQPPEKPIKAVEAKAAPSTAIAPVPSREARKPQAPEARVPAAPQKTALAAPAPLAAPTAPPGASATPPAPASPTKPVEQSTAPAPGIQEMTPADQEGMPKLSLQLLVYSDIPAERLVFINNQKYVEGQSVEGKVLVEGILPDGAILSYQGKRFKLHQ